MLHSAHTAHPPTGWHLPKLSSDNSNFSSHKISTQHTQLPQILYLHSTKLIKIKSQPIQLPLNMVSTRSNIQTPIQPKPSARGTSTRGRGRPGRGRPRGGRGRGALTRGNPQSLHQSSPKESHHHESIIENQSDAELGDGANNESEEEVAVGITLENFENYLDSWTIPSLRQVLKKRNNTSNRIPSEIQEVLNFQKAKYTKVKLLLALVGRVSEKTVNSWM